VWNDRPIFLKKNDEGTAVTVIGEQYQLMITSWLWPISENIDIEHFWFQQDRATCHIAREMFALVQEKFSI